MTANEFNKIDNTYLLFKQNIIKKCNENNVDYYNYLGSFVDFKLFNYISLKARVKVIRNLDFNNFIKTRAILNKRDFSNKQFETSLAVKEFKVIQKEVFDWLDKTNNPYFFIMNPVYTYGAGVYYKSHLSKTYGYKKIYYTGLDNLDIAVDYAKYKLNN